MESYWISEQESSEAWLVNASASEQEDVLDWIKSIGVGAAQGAGTGAAAGPWGALIGGLVGGGLGALQQATKPQSPPPQAQPAMPPRPPAAQVASSTLPQASAPAPPPAASQGSAGALQQFTQLLPQLVQIIQTLQPIAAATQQTQARTGEDIDENRSSWDGDSVPEDAFPGEQESWLDDKPRDDRIEPPGLLTAQNSSLAGEKPPISADASAMQPSGAPTLSFSDEWTTETEAEAMPAAGAGFIWVS